MTAPYTAAELAAISARAEAAKAMVHALNQPRGTMDAREWIMSIPARPDHDPDLVIHASLADVPRLVAELTRAREAIRDLLMICGEAHSESVYNALEEIKRARACLPGEDTSWQQKGDRAALGDAFAEATASKEEPADLSRRSSDTSRRSEAKTEGA